MPEIFQVVPSFASWISPESVVEVRATVSGRDAVVSPSWTPEPLFEGTEQRVIDPSVLSRC